MITERITFQAKYGHGDELVALFKESAAMMAEGATAVRLYTDATGAMFTVAAEIDYADLDAWTAANRPGEEGYSDPSFQEWFGKMMVITERGERQLFKSESLK